MIDGEPAQQDGWDFMPTQSLRRSLCGLSMLNRGSGQRVIPDYATPLLRVSYHIRLGGAGTASCAGMTGKPGIEGALAAVKAVDPMPSLEKLRPQKSGHACLFRSGARNEIHKLRTNPRRSIQSVHKLAPAIGVDSEAVSIGKQPLRPLPPALHEKLRERLPLNGRGPIEEGAILRLDTQIELLLCTSHDYIQRID
jgi:hypothetical protein